MSTTVHIERGHELELLRSYYIALDPYILKSLHAIGGWTCSGRRTSQTGIGRIPIVDLPPQLRQPRLIVHPKAAQNQTRLFMPNQSLHESATVLPPKPDSIPSTTSKGTPAEQYPECWKSVTMYLLRLEVLRH